VSLIGVGEYPAVRAALDVSLTAAALPDATIALDIFQGAAEREVLDRYPDASSQTGETLLSVIRAAVYLTAANLVGSMRTETETEVDDLRVRYAPVDSAKRYGELRAKAELELAALAPTASAEETSARMFTFFGAAPGYRGR
jgi:predicted nucleic acid-binding protein